MVANIHLEQYDKPPVVVLRSNDNCFLDVLRCFGEADIPVIPVIFSWTSASAWISEESRYFKNPVTIANPAEHERLASDQLEELGALLFNQFKRKVLLVTTSDTSLVFVNKHFERLGKYYLQQGSEGFDRPCWKELRKDSFYNVMKQAGVPIPTTYSVNHHADIMRAVENITYPCIYKPSIKTIDNAFTRIHGAKAVECSSRDELRRGLDQALANGFQTVVQEKIEFTNLEEEVSCYLYADGDGRVRMTSAQHKIVQHPARYGTGVVSKTFNPGNLSAIASSVAHALNWHGFIGVELMFSKATQQWVVIEANLRPWLSIYFQAANGFNYPAMLYADYMGRLGNGVISASDQNIKPLRINLTALINMMVEQSGSIDLALKTIIAKLAQHKEKIVFSYYVDSDPNPGRRELMELSKRFPGNESYFLELERLMSQAGSDCDLR